jgi:hypothetical protein
MAISISLSHGVDGFRLSDFTTGALAPGAGDTEVRFNTTDTNSTAISRNDTIKHLKAIIRALESSTFVVTSPGL